MDTEMITLAGFALTSLAVLTTSAHLAFATHATHATHARTCSSTSRIPPLSPFQLPRK